ncbi:MAG: VOC family protein [Acidipropionibacterium acidipropionici]|jgi:catechol 2,3-dioxygenase-like lactoylglutathione lyase family enzyme|uniref:VOC family protein n=1 Tax=Acidipropionibacterium acidipropionici TaxID=1748 RepID=UPI002F35AE36
MTDISLSAVPITVTDIDAALGFYRDALGLAVVGDVPAGDHRWVSLALGAGSTIVLSDPGAGRSAEDGRALAGLVTKGTGPGPYILATDDLDGAFSRARDAGADVVQEPADQPWGPRDCAFRDPSGNLIRIQAL